MLKNKHSPYIPGARRVGCWLKRKKRDLYDCIVIGFTKAKEGKFSGLIGAVVVGQYINGSVRQICNVSGMPDDVRKHMTDYSEHYLHKVCSVWAMEQDKNSKALIEPSWRGLRIDKPAEQCTPEVEREEDRMVEL